jgi:sec-independent protein translocase protein TatA
MMGLSLPHLLILLVIVVLIFGANRLPNVMGDFAKGIKAFRAGMREEEPKVVADQAASATIVSGAANHPAAGQSVAGDRKAG